MCRISLRIVAYDSRGMRDSLIRTTQGCRYSDKPAFTQQTPEPTLNLDSRRALATHTRTHSAGRQSLRRPEQNPTSPAADRKQSRTTRAGLPEKTVKLARCPYVNKHLRSGQYLEHTIPVLTCSAGIIIPSFQSYGWLWLCANRLSPAWTLFRECEKDFQASNSSY
jgi:hypothetical protein